MTDTIPAPHSTGESSIPEHASPPPPETQTALEAEAPGTESKPAPIAEDSAPVKSPSPPENPTSTSTSTSEPPSVPPSAEPAPAPAPASDSPPTDHKSTAVPATSPPPSDAPAAAPALTAPAAAPSSTKDKSRRKTRRPRRRGASSDSDGEGDHSDASSGSLSSASSVGSVTESEDEDDEDEKEVEASIDPSSPSKTGAAFVDPAKHTPVGWDAAKKGEEMEEVNFGSSDTARGRGGAIARGRGRGAAVGGVAREAGKEKEKENVVKPRKTVEEMTPEERKRFEDKRARKKEKFKAKKEELKAAKKKAAESKANGTAPTAESSSAKSPLPAEPKAAAKPKPAPKGKKDGTISSLEASTSALAINEPSPASAEPSSASQSNTLPPRPRNGNREAYADRLAKDPKFVPRVGGFWTHDQRLYEAGTVGEGGYTGLRGLSDYWRGRGRGGPGEFRGGRGDFRGGDRGGFRGRGRGGMGDFGPRGGAPRGGGHMSRPSWASVARGQEILDSPKSGGRRLEMDRVWDEEQARKSAPAPVPGPPPSQPSAPVQDPPADGSAATDEPPIAPQSNAAPSRGQEGSKWGHEAFESVQAVEAMRGMARGAFRGRGRGRGGFPMRGGFFPNNFPRPVSQNGGTPPTTSVQSASPVPPQSSTAAAPPKASSENTSTQPNAESLLGETSQIVTVNIPGSGVVEPLPPAPAPPAPVAPSSTPAAAVAPVAPSPIPPHVTGGSQPSPYTGSDSGSVPSTGQYIPPQPYLPPGIGIAPNGEYYNLANGAPVDFQPNPQAAYARPPFYPTHSQRGSYRNQAPSQYYQAGTGAYSPDFQPSPGDSYGGQSPMYFQQPAAGQNGYADRSSSPFGNPYAGQPSSLGYFAPPRSSKVSIRAPMAGSSRAGNSSSNAATSPAASRNTLPESSGHGQRERTAEAASFVPSQSRAQRGASTHGQSQGGAVYYQAQAYNPYTAAGSEVYPTDGSNGGYQMSQEAMQEWMAHQAAVAAANGWQGGYAGYEEYGYQ